MPKSQEVDAWFETYDNPMKAVVQRIRTLVLGADTRISECIKWQAPTFTYRGNLASFYPRSREHASLMFHTGAHIPGTHPRLEGTGDTSRVMKIGSVKEANAAKGDLERLVRAWCDSKDAPVVKPKTPKKPKPKAALPAKPTRASGYDAGTAERIREILSDRRGVVEKRMFGGLCFMVNDKMCCGLTKTEFMVRVGKDAHADALRQPHARPMDFTGRPLSGMVYVDAAGYETDEALAKWIARGLAAVAPVAKRAKS